MTNTKEPKLNITPNGKIFVSLLSEIKFKLLKVTFFKSILPLRNHGMDLRFSGNNGNIECTLYLR